LDLLKFHFFVISIQVPMDYLVLCGVASREGETIYRKRAGKGFWEGTKWRQTDDLDLGPMRSCFELSIRAWRERRVKRIETVVKHISSNG
jgi:hypothetical protein